MLSRVFVQRREVVKTFSSREAAGKALDHLVFSGFAIAQTFLLDENSAGQTSAKPESNHGAIAGTATGLKKGLAFGNLVGGTAGLLLGVGMLALPGVGQLTLSSAIAFVLLSGGVCTAAGGLAGGLIGLGLSSEQVKDFSQQISQGRVLLVFEGTSQEIDRARQLLQTSKV